MSIDPEIYEKAARLIEEKGWWRGGDGKFPVEGSGYCAATAVASVERTDGIAPEDPMAPVLAQAGVSSIGYIFKMNDNQPDYETGKQWAISLLRETAASIRGEQK